MIILKNTVANNNDINVFQGLLENKKDLGIDNIDELNREDDKTENDNEYEKMIDITAKTEYATDEMYTCNPISVKSIMKKFWTYSLCEISGEIITINIPNQYSTIVFHEIQLYRYNLTNNKFNFSKNKQTTSTILPPLQTTSAKNNYDKTLISRFKLLINKALMKNKKYDHSN